MTKYVDAEAVETFARISGDTNPVHLDEKYAAKTQFGKRIAHGLLISSYISAVLGTILPGPGSIYLSQTVSFKRPVYLGDEITATVTVTNIRPDKPIVTLKTTCANQNRIVVIDGEAILLCPQIEKLG
jgi:3-hydroxybutyryl-CoA dehydratase